ncbi:MAG: diguanylate cyclase domain-containing protein [Acidimicrobiales bacterium]
MSLVGRFLDWVSPPLPTADAEIERAVRDALDRGSIHLNRVVAPLVPPTALSWVLLLWSRADHRRLVVWFLLVCAGSVLMLATTRRGWVDRTAPAAVIRRLSTVLLANGSIFGSLSFLARPTEPASWSLVGMMIMATLSSNVIFAASIARMFWSFQIPLAVVGAAGFLATGDGLGYSIATILLYALPFSAVLARIKRSTDERAAYFAVTSQRTAEELRVLNDELAHQASHDHLTGLPNRQEFLRRLERAMGQADDHQPVVLYLDLDRFKVLNDRLGHAAGDEALRITADRIRHHLRPGDIVARIGGDEFTALLQGTGAAVDVGAVAERIVRSFDEPVPLSAGLHPLGISIGAARATPTMSAEDLLHRADLALYTAKEAGRGHVHLDIATAERDDGDRSG